MTTTTSAVADKIKEAANTGSSAPRLKTIARFINDADNGHRAVVETISANSRFDRTGRRISVRTNTRERTANQLTVYRTTKDGTYPVYDYDSDDPYWTNADVCRWVVQNIIGA